ncbi:MAG: hypothetical protein HZB38_05705 [Planctomycetes bacterium]|nr:hypothetical protein [Planctomycetota bacterium]
MRTTLAVLLVLAAAAPSFAQLEPRNAAAAARPAPAANPLDRRIPAVSFDEVPLDQVLDWLQSESGLNVVARWEVLGDMGVSRDKAITLHVRNLRLSQVIWLIMNQAAGPDLKLAYRACDNLLILSTEDNLGREMLVRIYDVADLLLRVPSFPRGPHVDPQGQQASAGGGGGTVLTGGASEGGENTPQPPAPGQVDPDMQTLIELILSTVQPDSWERNGGLGTIAVWRNRLVVRANIRVHQELAGPLVDLEK